MSTAKVYVGCKTGQIYWTTTRESMTETWDAIFYVAERGSAQFPREDAPRKMSQMGWRILELTVQIPSIKI